MQRLARAADARGTPHPAANSVESSGIANAVVQTGGANAHLIAGITETAFVAKKSLKKMSTCGDAPMAPARTCVRVARPAIVHASARNAQGMREERVATKSKVEANARHACVQRRKRKRNSGRLRHVHVLGALARMARSTTGRASRTHKQMQSFRATAMHATVNGVANVAWSYRSNP